MEEHHILGNLVPVTQAVDGPPVVAKVRVGSLSLWEGNHADPGHLERWLLATMIDTTVAMRTTSHAVACATIVLIHAILTLALVLVAVVTAVLVSLVIDVISVAGTMRVGIRIAIALGPACF